MSADPWEYRVEAFKNSEVRDLQDRLNRFGAQGWELVSMSTTVKVLNIGGNDLVCVFKRPGLANLTPEKEFY